jgi:beta-glucosidase
MPKAKFHFPRGFLWGTATASHQVEGNNSNNNWWAWEQEPDRIMHGHKSGLACDWWGGRWKEDFDRAAEGAHNAHRLSIEWSRIQPKPDRWDEDSLDHYRDMLRGLKERNISPLITLHHFSDPIWVSELGGWENENSIEYFIKYVSKVVEALAEYNNLWITINEPNVLVVNGYLLGLFPPGKRSLSLIGKVYTNLLRAHAAAYREIHRLQSTARVGIAINYRSAKPAKSWNPLDIGMVGLQSKVFNNPFPSALLDGVLRLPISRRRIPETKGTQDFLGLNYYTRDYLALSLLHPRNYFLRRYFRSGADLSDTGFLATEPDGMFEALKWGLQYNVPIIITENGIEDAEDRIRPSYIIQHIHQIWRGINFNWPIKGYFYWTLVDNFEWERGWTQRFGLWELDEETQIRRKRPSADLFAEICDQNGISSESVQKYAPEIFSKIFPGPG